MRTRPALRPVLKWAGGKSQLLTEILSRLPARMETYYEPFLGGGAVFFALAREGRFDRAVLADRNPELIEVYAALKQDVEAVIAALKTFRHDEETYYKVRDSRPRVLVRRAARFIYLNKTGYNGLYRVNRAGDFNVPFGRYKKPNYCDEVTLRAAAAALKGAELKVADFQAVALRATPRDAVYLDPPYLPLSRTSNFTAYDRHPFGLPEHERLASLMARLEQGQVPALLSNSDTPVTRSLFKPFKLEIVQVPRHINSKATGRGKVNEILVSTHLD